MVGAAADDSRTMTHFIGISGKPGSVKEFFRFKILQELRFHGYSVAICSLADELYRQINTLIDQVHHLDSTESTPSQYEELAVAFHIPQDQKGTLFNLLAAEGLGDKHPQYGYSRRNAHMRQALSSFALILRQAHGDDYLIESMSENTPDIDFAIFTDLRFPNEADWLNNHEGLPLRVEVDVEAVIAHYGEKGGYKYSREGMNAPTETALDEYADFYIRFDADAPFDRVAFGREILDLFDLPHKEEIIR